MESEPDHGAGYALDNVWFSRAVQIFPYLGVLESLPGTTLKSSCLFDIGFATAFFFFFNLSGSISTLKVNTAAKLPSPLQNAFVKEHFDGIQIYFSEHLE